MCHLLMAKTRLMPLKTISIPQGELMGCQLAVRVAKTVCEQLDLSMRDVKYLSDSTTALWWIYGEPRNFSLFVANRVAEVLTESYEGISMTKFSNLKLKRVKSNVKYTESKLAKERSR